MEYVEEVRVSNITTDLPLSGTYGVFATLAKLLWDEKNNNNNQKWTKNPGVTQKTED